MVSVFREVFRVLRDDGTLWVNMGDCYNSVNGFHRGEKYMDGGDPRLNEYPDRRDSGLKPKDLVGIPWLLAKALQAPYYTGRIKSEMDRVWLGAMIDAEGTICGFTHKRKDNGDIRHGINITVTNSNRMLLDRCFEIWHTTREDHNSHGKGHLGTLDTWRWIIHGIEEKSSLLRELYPYFTAKKKQALIAWNFLEISRNTRGRNKGEEGDSNREKYAWAVHALSKLNHLESVDVPSWCKEPPSLYEPGWYLRSDIIWSKPNPMPESVTDRPTKAHEYIFLLSKRERYYYDNDAVREAYIPHSLSKQHTGPRTGIHKPGWNDKRDPNTEPIPQNPNGRNLRSIWTISTQPYPEAHFATFPEEIPKRAILAGTSARGCCPECGGPWERVVEKSRATFEKTEDPTLLTGRKGMNRRRPGESEHYVLAVPQHALAAELAKAANGREDEMRERFGSKWDHWTRTDLSGARIPTRGDAEVIRELLGVEVPFNGEAGGWRPTCSCNRPDTVPAVVCDPFCGSGTTVAVAESLGRRGVGCELKAEYIELARKRMRGVTLGLPL